MCPPGHGGDSSGGQWLACLCLWDIDPNAWGYMPDDYLCGLRIGVDEQIMSAFDPRVMAT